MPLLTSEGALTEARELSVSRCRELLEVATVGRLGFVTAGGVQIVPLSYRSSDDVLYLSTRSGSLIDQLGETGSEVAFEVDYHGPSFGVAWSVLMHGRLSTLDAADTKLVDELRLPIVSWATGHLRHLKFVPRAYTGRTITRTAP